MGIVLHIVDVLTDILTRKIEIEIDLKYSDQSYPTKEEIDLAIKEINSHFNVKEFPELLIKNSKYNYVDLIGYFHNDATCGHESITAIWHYDKRSYTFHS